MKNEITTRSDLALLVPDGGTFIELGVAAGEFAEAALIRNPKMCYFGIDRWMDHHDEAEMRTAIDRIWRFSDANMKRSTFSDVCTHVKDESIDLIYIDGYAHTGQNDGETLDQWYPKLKPGGWFCGHDYSPEYQPTIDAVDTFVAKLRSKGETIDFKLTKETSLPSWYFQKPE